MTTKTSSKQVKIISISDVHLGHSKTLTEDTIKGMREILFKNPKLVDADLLIIGGDWTHTHLSFTDNHTRLIYTFMVVLLEWCRDRKIKVRVLKGTPSHDWDQCEWFVRINQSGGIGCDLKYFNEVCIERMDDLGIDVLYVPDEWKDGPEDAEKDVIRCMTELGLTKVDVSVVHGTFEHHLPEFIKTHKHSNRFYAGITRYVVLIGHIHTHSIVSCDNVLLATNGSFDRTAHGEEEPKGLILVEINKISSVRKLTFIENNLSTLFKTIHCHDDNLEASLKHIEKSLEGILKGHIRLRVGETNPLNSSVRELYAKYPALSWKKEVIVGDRIKRAVQENIKIDISSTPMHIDKNNICELISKELKNYSQEEIDNALSLMNKLIGPLSMPTG